MDRESVQTYVKSAQSAIEDSPQMGEATTKAALLRDFIELLNWEIPTNTELEYSVQALGKTFKVDYALVLDGRPIAFLEAKGLDTSLNPDHREQLSEYLRSEDVNWGILTNGEEYEFYQRRVINSKVIVESVEKTTLQRLPQTNILTAYQTEKIRDRESKQIVEHIRELRESLETLRSNKDELSAEVVDLLTGSISESIASEVESQAKEMLDRIADEIESEINPDIIEDTDNRESSPPETVESDDVYWMELTVDGSTIQKFTNTVQSELLILTVDYLIESHGLISEIEPLPYIPGQKRAIINDEPTYDSEEMALPRELADGHYLETNLSWEQKKREVRRMAEACGVGVVAGSPSDEES